MGLIEFVSLIGAVGVSGGTVAEDVDVATAAVKESGVGTVQ